MMKGGSHFQYICLVFMILVIMTSQGKPHSKRFHRRHQRTDKYKTLFGLEKIFDMASKKDPATAGITSKTGKPAYIQCLNTNRGCNSNFTSRIGCLGSPGVVYSKNWSCNWTIIMPHGELIRLHFIDFALENEVDCTSDKLIIFDGEESISHGTESERLCGTKLPKDFVSKTSILRIQMQTNEDIAMKGFRLQWSSVANITGRHPCNSKLTGTNGRLDSEHYPNNYPNSHDCTWTIEGNGEDKILIEFVVFDVDRDTDDDDCKSDRLLIYDGTETAPSRLLCGSEIPDYFLSRHSTVIIRMKTDGFTGKKGFSLYWSIVDHDDNDDDEE